MKNPGLYFLLEPVIRRKRRVRKLIGLSCIWGGAAILCIIAVFLNQTAGAAISGIIPIAIFAAIFGAPIYWWLGNNWTPDLRELARQIEHSHPELKDLLKTAVEMKPDPKTGKFSYLQEKVLRDTYYESQIHPWIHDVPGTRILGAQALHAAGLLMFIGAILSLKLNFESTSPSKAVAYEEMVGVVEVVPGDTEVERGGTVVVMARFQDAMPSEATLVVTNQEGQSRRIGLSKNLDDPIFGGPISNVDAAMSYHVEFDDKRTLDFQISVYEFPELVKSDALLTYPDYTGLDQRKIEDTTRVTAVEGAELEWSFQLNKPVQSVRLLNENGEEVEVIQDAAFEKTYTSKYVLESTERYKLELVDADGRANKSDINLRVAVLENKAPELKLQAPRGDQEFSAIEEVIFDGEAADDFGVLQYGLAYSIVGEDTEYIALGSVDEVNEEAKIDYELYLEEFDVQPNQLINYYLWAEDYGPDGEVRRNYGDMYFATIREFEQIFREGQAPSGDQQQQQQQEEEQQQQDQQGQPGELAEIQKDIINATWNIFRGRTPKNDEQIAQFVEDVTVVLEAQQDALEQAQTLAAEAADEEAVSLANQVTEAMQSAIENLSSVIDDVDINGLNNALTPERVAYQALLELNVAEETQVAMAQQQQQGQQQGQQTQRGQNQLNQLELSQEDDLYETENQASSLQSPEQQQQLESLNRLRELAQRQEDLNERLQELQTALEEAQDEEEEERIRRELKRLQEEQREMIQDLDETRQQIAENGNQQSRETLEQLDETRDNMQDVAEQLEEGNPGSVQQAAASGARAQQELEEVRDEIRQSASSQFQQEMQQMRSDAQEMAENQAEIGQQLDELLNGEQRSLDNSDERNELAERLREQEERFNELLENIQEVSEAAEDIEPLLANQLYDTFRETDPEELETAVEAGSLYLERGFLPNAADAERAVANEVDQLAQRIQRAADSVLGSEEDSLRLASSQIEQLRRELEQELQRLGQQGEPGENQQAQNGQNGQPGEPQEGQQGQHGQGAAQGQNNPEEEQESEQQLAQAGQQGQQGQEGQQGQGAGQQPQQNDQQQQPGQGGQGQQQAQNEEQNQQPGQGQGQQQAQNQQQPGQGAGQGQGQPGQQQQQAQNDQENPQQGQGGQGQNPGQNGQQNPQTAQGGGGGAGGNNNGGFFFEGENFDPEMFEGPFAGNDFTEWRDRLSDVENMLTDEELRNQASEILDDARAIRTESIRRGAEPQWDLVQSEVLEPLAELQVLVNETLANLKSEDSLAPIDRDPVPPRFADVVSDFFERVGGGETNLEAQNN